MAKVLTQYFTKKNDQPVNNPDLNTDFMIF